MDIMGFPECITSLTGLEEVMLHKCQNMEVPCSISRLTGLKTLAMVECGMERLSSPVCDLPSLEVLNVSMNQLGQHQDCLPAMMLTLTGLKQLGLCCNDYDALPDVVLKLTSLQVSHEVLILAAGTSVKHSYLTKCVNPKMEKLLKNSSHWYQMQVLLLNTRVCSKVYVWHLVDWARLQNRCYGSLAIGSQLQRHACHIPSLACLTLLSCTYHAAS